MSKASSQASLTGTVTSHGTIRAALASLLLVSLFAVVGWTLYAPRQETLPSAAVASRQTPRPSQQRCAECHADITDAYATAPHSRTLVRTSDAPVIEQFAGRTFHQEETGVELSYTQHDGRLWVSTPAYGRDVPIEWVFGSGTHARTPLITWTDEVGRTASIEHSVSWYPEGQLGVTLGLEDRQETSGVGVLGAVRTPAETLNCFGCHCTFVATTGDQVDFDEIQPGVGCVRCHWNTEEHVREMDNALPSTIERFSAMTPIEAVNRCGECHRRAEEMGGPIEPDDPIIIRFASVGLPQSPCFQQQQKVILDSNEPARLDCTTCHNPHRPTNPDWRFHAAVCLNCHDADQGRALDCSAATREENCLSCHMPKVPANDNLQFTDHWIRIRPSVP